MGFRRNVVTAITTVAQTYATANPTLLRKVESARPASFAETPIAYVRTRSESLLYPGGDVQQRTIRPVLVVVDAAPDSIEQADRMDDLADALIAAYAAAYHQVSGSTLLTPVGLEDIEDEVGGVSYPGFAITFEALEIVQRP